MYATYGLTARVDRVDHPIEAGIHQVPQDDVPNLGGFLASADNCDAARVEEAFEVADAHIPRLPGCAACGSLGLRPDREHYPWCGGPGVPSPAAPLRVRAVDEELAYSDVFALRRGRVGAELLVDGLLERIGELDSPGTSTALRSVLAVSPRAGDEARACDRSPDSGPLHGVPVLVKDNIEVAGLPSTAGATSLASRPARADAPLVGRLRAAGAIILGTTNLSEWANIRSARSTSGWSAVGGLTGNPWALDRSPGGSSSGSAAAVAAGFAPLAIGTETDGSITCPASLNGVAGIKPTVGSVPTAGVVPISASQDSPGPIARTVDEVALLLEVLSARSGILDRARRTATCV